MSAWFSILMFMIVLVVMFMELSRFSLIMLIFSLLLKTTMKLATQPTQRYERKLRRLATRLPAVSLRSVVILAMTTTTIVERISKGWELAILLSSFTAMTMMLIR